MTTDTTPPLARDSALQAREPGPSVVPKRAAGIGGLAVLAALTVLPLVVGESWLFLTTDFLVMALFAMSYNLLFGHTGLLSFGHAAFYGMGAYTVAILADRLGLNPLLGLIFAPAGAAALALVIGFFTVRVTGMYFAMLTLAFSQLAYTVVMGWYDLAGGDNGLPVMLPDYLLPAANLYYVALLTVAISIGLLFIITNSAFGVALAAIRQNPQRAASIGINLHAYQIAAFVAAGAFAGVAGGLRVLLQQMALPSMLYWTQSADPVLMALAGGTANFAGPIVGAAIFVFLNFFVTAFTDYPLFAFGLLVLFVVLFMPGGVVGALGSLRDRLRPGGRMPP